MTTAQNMIEEAKRYLLASHREQLNTLNGGINSSVTTITLTNTLGSLVAGSVITVDIEIMYVWSADAAGKTAVVQRGFQGSTAASHSSGALVTINPKFPDFSIFQALNASINDMSGDLFAAKTVTFTFIAGKYGYDLTGATSCIGSLEGKYDYPGIQRDWPILRSFYIRRDSNTTDFPSGYAIILKQGAFPGREVRITYAAELSPLVSVTDDVLAVAGLDAGWIDIPPLGAAVRLQGVREGQRNFNDNQPDTRRAAEVPAGSQIQSIRATQDFYKTRIQGERKTLMMRYPYHQKLEPSGGVASGTLR